MPDTGLSSRRSGVLEQRRVFSGWRLLVDRSGRSSRVGVVLQYTGLSARTTVVLYSSGLSSSMTVVL